eukprot:403358683
MQHEFLRRDIKPTKHLEEIYTDDQTYVKRCMKIFEACKVNSGQIPFIQYDKEESHTWDQVFEKYQHTLKNHAAQEVQEAFSILMENRVLRTSAPKCQNTKREKFTPANNIEIPQLAELSNFLKRNYGWVLKPVPGLISNRDYFLALANKVYCCSQSIRRAQDVEFSPYPDYIHDFLGHILPLSSPKVSKILYEIGQLSIGASEEQLEILTDAYWKAFEIGFIKQKNEFKAIGGAVLSSHSELMNALNNKQYINRLELINYQEKSKIDDLEVQNQYFYIEDLEEIIEKVKYKILDFKNSSNQQYILTKGNLQQLNNNSPNLSFWEQSQSSNYSKEIKIDEYHLNLQSELDKQTNQQLSFPIRHHNFEKMSPYLRHYLNNHGDSFQTGTDYNGMRTRQIEKQVIQYFADFYRLPSEYKEKHWGYMTSGSTESNTQALYFARELFKDHENVAVFYSSKAHSAFSKSLYYLKMDHFGKVGNKLNLQLPNLNQSENEWPDRLPVKQDGSIDTQKLRDILEPFAQNKIPAVFIMTAGTTAECAFDNIQEAVNVITSFDFYKNGKNFWLHVDGAWCGPYARLLQIGSLNDSNNLPKNIVDATISDFSIPHVRSITTSIHKWIPSPFPSSVLLIKDNQDLPNGDLKEIYLKGYDYTLTTSRNGHAPLFTWDYLMRNDVNTQVQDAIYTFNQAKNFYQQLQNLELELGENLNLLRNEPLGLNIKMKKPSDEVCYKYGLMTPGSGEQALLFIMADKTQQLFDQFIQDYKEDFIRTKLLQGNYKTSSISELKLQMQ